MIKIKIKRKNKDKRKKNYKFKNTYKNKANNIDKGKKSTKR
jgi:hypothetical protein